MPEAGPCGQAPIQLTVTPGGGAGLNSADLTLTSLARTAGSAATMTFIAGSGTFGQSSNGNPHIEISGATPATLTTAGGGITRLDDRTIELVIPGASSTRWKGSVVMDVVRTDTAPDLHMGFFLTVPVVQPVTVL